MQPLCACGLYLGYKWAEKSPPSGFRNGLELITHEALLQDYMASRLSPHVFPHYSVKHKLGPFMPFISSLFPVSHPFRTHTGSSPGLAHEDQLVHPGKRTSLWHLRVRYPCTHTQCKQWGQLGMWGPWPVPKGGLVFQTICYPHMYINRHLLAA